MKKPVTTKEQEGALERIEHETISNVKNTGILLERFPSGREPEFTSKY